ncbi:diacylglycerol kinase [Paraburkholderia sp. BL21I4N1]|uniref:diacylglycerol kinase n=1 Tax=Paraburkholderia sp. BL21I4N1 TaxID=1938801 RepID=UPI000CFCFA93|nr:diacylglycerol kinase [Paraburkholderia sp. BL21I4N1]PQV44664.1 diacylglycerol kinase (ATP) [Paraburkholderia sp. BL21I4N1]
MPIRQSTAARATPRALRAIDGASETANIEPFDDVSEPGAPDHTERAQGLNGMNGAHGASHAGAAHAASAAGANHANANPAHTGDGTETQHEPLSPDDPLAPLPFNPYKGNRGLTRAWHAMKNSLAGFRVAIREESAFRQELTLAAILIPCGVLVPVEPVSRVLLLGSVLLVLIVELLNSSVEAAIDRISLERHELSRRAKDLGSAAVMVALGMCVMTWGLIVGPLVVHWIRTW